MHREQADQDLLPTERAKMSPFSAAGETLATLFKSFIDTFPGKTKDSLVLSTENAFY